MPGQGVLEYVTAGVVGLGTAADDASDGREEDEEVETLREERVKVPASVDLGANGGEKCGMGHALERFVLKRSFALDNCIFCMLACALFNGEKAKGSLR